MNLKNLKVDFSSVKFLCHFQCEYTPLLTRWFKAKREGIEITCKLLIIKIFFRINKSWKMAL
nr:DUF1493 family protein [Pantoea stewartii]